jgi:hypothetical protein
MSVIQMGEVATALDTQVRLGGIASTAPTDTERLKLMGTGSNGYAAFLGFHPTPTAPAYFESLWDWLADHIRDGNHQHVSIYSGRACLARRN